jgi:hypothetical protein
MSAVELYWPRLLREYTKTHRSTRARKPQLTTDPLAVAVATVGRVRKRSVLATGPSPSPTKTSPRTTTTAVVPLTHGPVADGPSHAYPVSLDDLRPSLACCLAMHVPSVVGPGRGHEAGNGDGARVTSLDDVPIL